jgi:hypothetical protein
MAAPAYKVGVETGSNIMKSPDLETWNLEPLSGRMPLILLLINKG